jgi:hypothetical protein
MLFGHEALRDRERELRRSAEDRRRLESRHERSRPDEIDAEIRNLIRREEAHTACENCPDEELVREAG